MATWWRSVIGIVAGGAQAYAGGTNWKSILAGIGIAVLGIVTHVTSTSSVTSPTGVELKPGARKV